MGISLLYTGEIVECRPHLKQTLGLYNPIEHRALAIRFGQDARAHALCYRSCGLVAPWLSCGRARGGSAAIRQLCEQKRTSESRRALLSGPFRNVGGRRVKVPRKQLALLAYLLEHLGRAIPYERLHAIGGATRSDSRSSRHLLRQHMSTLREILLAHNSPCAIASTEVSDMPSAKSPRRRRPVNSRPVEKPHRCRKSRKRIDGPGDPRRGAADCGEHRQAAGTARQGMTSTTASPCGG